MKECKNELLLCRFDLATCRGVMAWRSHGLLVSKCWRVLLSLQGNSAMRPKLPRHVYTPRNDFRNYGRCTERKTISKRISRCQPGLRLHFGQLRQLRQFRQRRHLPRFVLDGILGGLIFGGLIFGGLIFGGLIFGGFIRCEELYVRDRLDEREELEDREEPNGVRLKRIP